MLKLRNNLTLNSHLRYLLWRTTGYRYNFTAQLMTGQHITIRRPPAQDISTANEIFVQNVYQCPRQLDAKNVKTIVDVGANVGYSCIYWLHQFPFSRVIAFEPHPIHIKQIKLHLQMNQLTERVTLLASAAGTQSGEMFLTDMGPESTLLATLNYNTLSVPVVDWFIEIGEEQIDLLKIDIEGSEYLLLADTRFESLKIKTFVLEWHNTSDYPDGRTWCIERLSQLGYSIVPGKVDKPPIGLLWAFRKDCL
jgi:FkbM family methyltransferase